jgi:opacity protein-like surface antigen
MKKTVFCIALVLLLLASAPVMAIDRGYLYPGAKEFTLVGSGSSDENFDGTTLSLEAGLGYFLTHGLEIALRQGVSYVELPGNDIWNGSTRAALDYHFGAGPLYPFIGAHVGYVYGDSVRDQFVAGPEIGLKFFANEAAFLFGMIEYQFLFRDADEIEDNFDDGRFAYSLGVGLTF